MKIVNMKIVLLAAILGVLALTAVAQAGNCQTNCTRLPNGNSTCNTFCY